MGANRIHITFTRAEYEYFSQRAGDKDKSLYTLLQSEITRSFGGYIVPENQSCIESPKERIDKTIDVSDTTWKSIECVCGLLNVSPSQLVYRVVIAPHLAEIMKLNFAKK